MTMPRAGTRAEVLLNRAVPRRLFAKARQRSQEGCRYAFHRPGPYARVGPSSVLQAV
jgi:hypothetical protein